MNRRVTIVTGSRADYGLLRPVIAAIRAEDRLDAEVMVTGTHLLGANPTSADVIADGPVGCTIPMQVDGETGRFADAIALGRGVSGFATAFADATPDVVLVLGDRIEAFAAASAAAVAGIRVAHMHGGDRAEGVADESLRHAISKLAHLHLAATARSAERLVAMGEEPSCTHLVGSPAVDGLATIEPLDDATYNELGAPEILFLLHPTGDAPDLERQRALDLLDRCRAAGRVLALEPNHDPGREAIMAALAERPDVRCISHLDRHRFIGLLRRCRMVAGNSSAGLIECAVLGVRCLDVGARQAGRERPLNVIRCANADNPGALALAVERTLGEPMPRYTHPYGDGRTGERVAELLATFDSDKHPIRKQNSY